MITNATGVKSHGYRAIAWMFCASCSSTPQLIAGGRSPSPRNESEVSLMMIAGIASVVAGTDYVERMATRMAIQITPSCP